MEHLHLDENAVAEKGLPGLDWVQDSTEGQPG